MKIKVIKCSSENYWYYGLDGDVFDVIYEDATDYVVEPDKNLILKKDCEVIEQKPWYETGNLPPVDTECLAVCSDGEYHKVKIVMIDESQCVAVFEDPSGPGLKYYWQTASRFKPLKSKEGIEKEEAVEELVNDIRCAIIVEGVDDTFKSTAEYLYELGYRKLEMEHHITVNETLKLLDHIRQCLVRKDVNKAMRIIERKIEQLED